MRSAAVWAPLRSYECLEKMLPPRPLTTCALLPAKKHDGKHRKYCLSYSVALMKKQVRSEKLF